MAESWIIQTQNVAYLNRLVSMPKARLRIALAFLIAMLFGAVSAGCTTTSESEDVTISEVPSVSLQITNSQSVSERQSRQNTQAALRAQATAFRLLNRGLLAPAEREFRNSLVLDASLLRSIHGLGRVYMQRDSFALAEAMFDKVLESEPNDLETLNALGVLFDRQERHTESVEVYQKALLVEPEYVKAINNLGYSYFLQGEPENAREQYAKAVAIDPDYEPAWLNLALLHFQLDDQPAALDAFEKVYAPHRALNNLGYLNLLSGELNVARENFAASLNSTDQYYLDAVRNLELLERPASQSKQQDPVTEQVRSLLNAPVSNSEDSVIRQSDDDTDDENTVDDDTLLGR